MQVRFAQTLSQLRHEKGVSQRQAAQALEVSQALLSHYENGIREPGLAFVVRACDYYQVSADYLLGRRVEREGGRAQGAPEGVDPAVLRSAAEVLTQLCLELCRRHPDFYRLAGSDTHQDGDEARAGVILPERVHDSYQYKAMIEAHRFRLWSPEFQSFVDADEAMRAGK